MLYGNICTYMENICLFIFGKQPNEFVIFFNLDHFFHFDIHFVCIFSLKCTKVRLSSKVPNFCFQLFSVAFGTTVSSGRVKVDRRCCGVLDDVWRSGVSPPPPPRCLISICLLSREDVRTANVIAAETVTCLVIDRE